MIVLTEKEWVPIRRQLKTDYAWKPSIFLIRESMKKELGFTIREHRTYHELTGSSMQICLDFYDEVKETWFRMKYL